MYPSGNMFQAEERRKNGGEKMTYEATKLVYSDGRPQWLTPDGAFIPARRDNDGTISASRLLIRDRSRADKVRVICG